MPPAMLNRAGKETLQLGERIDGNLRPLALAKAVPRVDERDPRKCRRGLVARRIADIQRFTDRIALEHQLEVLALGQPRVAMTFGVFEQSTQPGHPEKRLQIGAVAV